MKFIIRGKEYKAKEISDLTLGEYNEMFQFVETETDPVELNKGLLLLFTDIPLELVEDLDNSIYQINWRKKLEQKIGTQELKKEYLGYKLTDLNKIIVGRYIDADYFLTNSPDTRIQKVIASLLANEDDDIEVVDSIAKNIEDNLSLGECLVIFNHFVNWREDMVKKYKGLFSSPNEEEEDEDIEVLEGETPPDLEEEDEEEVTEGWGWLGICYEYAEQFYHVNHINIFEAPLTSLLNWLSWNKEKAEKEMAEMKRKNSSNF